METRFNYEMPELTELSRSALRGTLVGAGDSACTDELQELDGGGFEFDD